MTPKTKTIDVHRSSIDGRFVPKVYADKHPDTTEKEKIKISPPKKAGK